MSAEREYSPEENPHKGNKGLLRAWYALHNSWDGLVFAVREESAFRQELTLAICLMPLAIFLPFESVERLLLVGSIVLVLVVAVVLAVSLDPIVGWIENRRVPRTAAAVIVAVAIVALVGGFLWLTWSSLASQWQQVSGELVDKGRELSDRMPPWLRSALGSSQGSGASGESSQ